MVDILRSLTVRASQVRRQHPRTRRHFVHVEFNFAQSRVRENRSGEFFLHVVLGLVQVHTVLGLVHVVLGLVHVVRVCSLHASTCCQVVGV